MPRRIGFTRYISLMGVGVAFEAATQTLTDHACDLFSLLRDGDEIAHASIPVHVEIYCVRDDAAQASQPGHGDLFLRTQAGIAHGDARSGRGRLLVMPGHQIDEDLLHTLTLFLVGRADRIPVHASAIMLGGTACVLAGPSGAGKSTLALAGLRAGLPILSDDTIYVQSRPGLAVWSLARALHVYDKDAPGLAGPMRLRGGRLKKAVPLTAPPAAHRAMLCLLTPGSAVQLEPMAADGAVAALMGRVEAGFDLFRQELPDALRALARGGCFRLTLSRDPSEAIGLLTARMRGW